MDILIFGAGSLGSLLGGLLAREHDVTLLGRAPHVGMIRESGLTIDGEINTTVHPATCTDLPAEYTTELAIVTVKSYDTVEAATVLSNCELEVALSLQNGMGNEDTLAATLSCPVLAGTCSYGALLDAPGRVTCTGLGEVVLGARMGGESALARRVGAAFDAAVDVDVDVDVDSEVTDTDTDTDTETETATATAIETTVATDMPRRLWEKLAVNAGINATTALARVENGALLDGPANEVAVAAARETAQAAQAAGIKLDEHEAVTALERVADATAPNSSSMQQDVLDGRRTEVDAINGYVADCEPETPVNWTLAGVLRAWERAHGLR